MWISCWLLKSFLNIPPKELSYLRRKQRKTGNRYQRPYWNKCWRTEAHCMVLKYLIVYFYYTMQREIVYFLLKNRQWLQIKTWFTEFTYRSATFLACVLQYSLFLVSLLIRDEIFLNVLKWLYLKNSLRPKEVNCPIFNTWSKYLSYIAVHAATNLLLNADFHLWLFPMGLFFGSYNTF